MSLKKVAHYAAVLLLVLLLSTSSTFAAQTKIQLWHTFSGSQGKALDALVKEFNSIQKEIIVEAQFTGSYAESLNKLKLAIQSNTVPHIVEAVDYGTQTLIDSGAIIPIQDLQGKFATKLDLEDFLPQVLSYYRANGKLYALPFGASNPILYYNKDHFKAAGLDPNKPPVTYEEFMDAARRLTIVGLDGKVQRAGASWAIRSWLVEQEVALQNALLVDNNNGRDARATRVLLNEKPALNFITMWSEMAKKGYYINPGRSWDEARNNFISGKSSMMLQSTAGIQRTLEAIGGKFELGTGFLPRPAGSNGGVIVSGNALWVLKGHPEPEVEAAWKFLCWLSEPEQQKKWHKATGYMPNGKTAIRELTEEGYYQKNPAHYTAVRQLMESPSNYATAGALLGPFPELRDLVEQAIERVLAKKQDPQEALNWATGEVNQIVKRYNLLAP